MNASMDKADLFFKDGILTVRFVENSIIDVEDVIYIYCYGLQESNKKPYGLLFDSSNTHELTEEAIVYLADKALVKNIIAMAYVLTSLLSKIRIKLFLIFEKPPITPKLFNSKQEAHAWLLNEVKAYKAAQQYQAV